MMGLIGAVLDIESIYVLTLTCTTLRTQSTKMSLHQVTGEKLGHPEESLEQSCCFVIARWFWHLKALSFGGVLAHATGRRLQSRPKSCYRLYSPSCLVMPWDPPGEAGIRCQGEERLEYPIEPAHHNLTPGKQKKLDGWKTKDDIYPSSERLSGLAVFEGRKEGTPSS